MPRKRDSKGRFLPGGSNAESNGIFFGKFLDINLIGFCSETQRHLIDYFKTRVSDPAFWDATPESPDFIFNEDGCDRFICDRYRRKCGEFGSYFDGKDEGEGWPGACDGIAYRVKNLYHDDHMGVTTVFDLLNATVEPGRAGYDTRLVCWESFYIDNFDVPEIRRGRGKRLKTNFKA